MHRLLGALLRLLLTADDNKDWFVGFPTPVPSSSNTSSIPHMTSKVSRPTLTVAAIFQQIQEQQNLQGAETVCPQTACKYTREMSAKVTGGVHKEFVGVIYRSVSSAGLDPIYPNKQYAVRGKDGKTFKITGKDLTTGKVRFKTTISPGANETYHCTHNPGVSNCACMCHAKHNCSVTHHWHTDSGKKKTNFLSNMCKKKKNETSSFGTGKNNSSWFLGFPTKSSTSAPLSAHSHNNNKTTTASIFQQIRAQQQLQAASVLHSQWKASNGTVVAAHVCAITFCRYTREMAVRVTGGLYKVSGIRNKE